MVLPNVCGHHTTPEQLERWENIHAIILEGPHAEIQRMLDSEECWHQGFGCEARVAMKSGAAVLPNMRLRDTVGTVVPFFGDVVDEVGSSGSVANAEAYYGQKVGEPSESRRPDRSPVADPPDRDGGRTGNADHNYDSARPVEGQTWNAEEFEREFAVLSFLAPYVTVVRRSDNMVCSLEFKYEPRIYWDLRMDPNQ